MTESVKFERKRVVGECELVERQVVEVARTEMENVAGEHQSPESHVDGEHPAVARIARVFHAAVVFLFLEFDKFAVKGFRVVGAVVFDVDSRVEHEFHGIAVAAQIDSSVHSGPDRVAKRFASAVVDAADKACRDCLPFVPVAEQSALFVFRIACTPAGIAPRVVEHLFRIGCRLPMVFEEKRSRFERPQVAASLGGKNRRFGVERRKKENGEENGRSDVAARKKHFANLENRGWKIKKENPTGTGFSLIS